MQEDKFLEKALKYINNTYGSQRKAAEAFGVSPTFINLALKAQDYKYLPEELINEIGYKRVRSLTNTYERIKDE